MRIIDPLVTTSTYNKIIAKYGGPYSLWQKIKIGGVGSPRVIYKSGLSTFDAIHYTDNQEQSLTNFQLLREGFIIRINKRQQLGIAIEKLNQLENIHLNFKVNSLTTLESSEFPELQIKFIDQPVITFEIPLDSYDGIYKYFSKAVFKNYFTRG